MNKKIVILGGGTNTYISNHLALSAPAYGTTARILASRFKEHSENKMNVELILTKMASIGRFRNTAPDTPEEVEALVDQLIADPDTRVIIFNVAMVDYKPIRLYEDSFCSEYSEQNHDIITDEFGKYAGRLSTSEHPEVCLEMTVQDKIIQKIRKERKDILLVGFKTTCGATKEEQFQKGLKLCKDASANIVFVNDVDKDRIEKLNQHLVARNDRILRQKISNLQTYHLGLQNIEDTIKKDTQEYIDLNEKAINDLQNNGLVTPEESSYWYNTRDEALDALVQMVLDRSHLHFTRSTIVDSETVPWNIRIPPPIIYATPPTIKWNTPDGLAPKEYRAKWIPNPLIPKTFRIVFDFIRNAGAYKLGPTNSTVGHMGIKLSPNEFLTTKRKTNFNKMEEVGLVRVITDDPDDVFGYKHFFEDKYTQTVNQINELETYLSKLEVWDKGRQEVIDTIKDLKYSLLYLKKEDKVIAFGAKPSVGGQSQRSLFEAFPDLDCIIHFHCPLRTKHRSEFNTTPQFGVECGSHECGENTAMNMKEFKLPSGRSVWAVHLDHHGPNIIFDSKTADPQEIIDFIGSRWALDKKTTGLSDELI